MSDQPTALPSGRFKVNRVDSRLCYRDNSTEESNLTNGDGHYSTYGTQYLQSLKNLTREVIPNERYYLEGLKNVCRPCLDDLRLASGFKRQPLTSYDLSDEDSKVVKLGWIIGVYIPCLLNIWGVMLFLRLSWVVGQAGIGQGILIIVTANTVTMITTISMSAVCTNGEIKGGGVYYMISRSLGPEFGAAIGLMLIMANSIAVAMYIVGFCESLKELLSSHQLVILDGGLNDTRIIGSVVLVIILIVALVGIDWVSKTQLLLLFILVAAQLDFLVGIIIGPKSDEARAQGFLGAKFSLLSTNLQPNYGIENGETQNIFTVFAVFFPAVTGIVAGANLSGNLKDPSHAIPKGTLLAIFTTFVSYVIYPILIGASVIREASGDLNEFHGNGSYSFMDCKTRICLYGSKNNAHVMKLVSAWEPLITAGCFAATLSSAIASLVGAPRVLQALAKDKLYPLIGFFSKTHGPKNDPIRGYFLCFFIGFCSVMLGELNAIAPLTSNFFLASYAMINFSCFHATLSNSPGWRPSFKFYNKWLSLIGTFLCVGVMFLSDWTTALVTFVFVAALYLGVAYNKPNVNWGSSTQAQTYLTALQYCLQLSDVEEHVKNYRPQILVMSGFPDKRPDLIDFGNLITKRLSLLVCGDIREEEQISDSTLHQNAQYWLKDRKIQAFYCSYRENSFYAGCKAIFEICGLGKLRPNMLLLGYKNYCANCPLSRIVEYVDVIHEAFDRNMAVGILRLPSTLQVTATISEKHKETFLQTIQEVKEKNFTDNLSDNIEVEESDSESKSGPTYHDTLNNMECVVEKKAELQEGYFKRKQANGFIDVWWLYDDGGLTLLLPHIIQTRSIYSSCKLRIFSLANKNDALDVEQKNLAALLSKFRIDFSDVVIVPYVTKKAKESSWKEFEDLIRPFKEGTNNESQDKGQITDAELLAFKEKINRHLRLRELLIHYSIDSKLVVMTLPMPRKNSVSAALYVAWLEILTKGMPPMLLVRGNQTSVLTFYS